jgi:hypothetical protein
MALATPTSPYLYSVNPLMKFNISRDYLGHKHYVWCADSFDARHHYLHPGRSDTPPSSNPGEIFERLRAATVARPDWNDPSISKWKLQIKSLLEKWKTDDLIDDAAEEEIVYLIDRADITHWRPLIYIINKDKVSLRLKRVPLSSRASIEMEYIIDDLIPDEFDVIGP